MKTNLATVIADLQARVLAPLEAMANGEASTSVAEAQAVRGRALMAEDFAALRSPSADPWHPPARDYGHPLLDATGALKDSADCHVGPRDDATGYSLTFQYTDEKAIWQHGGTMRNGRRHIPPRPLLFKDDAGAARWISELNITGKAALDQWLAQRFR